MRSTTVLFCGRIFSIFIRPNLNTANQSWSRHIFNQIIWTHILTKTELAPVFTANIHYSDLSNEENLMKCKSKFYFVRSFNSGREKYLVCYPLTCNFQILSETLYIVNGLRQVCWVFDVVYLFLHTPSNITRKYKHI